MKLLTVDVEAPLPDVPPPGVGEQWVLVRLHREPLGILKLTDGCASATLARLIADQFTPRMARHLVADTLGSGEAPRLHPLPVTCPRSRDVPTLTVTVAVCTRNGAERLEECLRALSALEYPHPQLDLLVVDNAPQDDHVRRLVEQQFPRVRYVPEPRPGLDWARNRAILEARGDIVAFTDDDVSVDGWWVDAIARVFARDPDVDCVTGLVVPDEIDVEPQRLFETYGGFGRGFERQYYRVDTAAGERAATRHGGSGRFGTGASMAFRKTTFERIGLFDPALDVGTPTNGGGDLEMFFRVLKSGGTLVYEPSAVVRHRHRRSYEKLREQITNNGIGFFAYLTRSAKAYPDERPALARLGAWWLYWWSLRRTARWFVRRDFPLGLILAELRGSFAGPFRCAPADRQAKSLASSFGPQRPYSSAPPGVHDAAHS